MTKKRMIVYIGLLGASLVLFGGIYGFSMLDPGNIAYIYNNFDTEQHYFGWLAYRDADWKLPPGLHDRLIYPDDTSVIFTDSIPILAFVFKLFSNLLPPTFQYFGIWALLSIFLTGVFSANILWGFCKKDMAVFLSSVLMMIAPTVMIRAFVHEALGGQWLLMMALWILFWVYRESTTECPGGFSTALVLRSAALGFLVAGIHMYFIPICGIILAGCALYLVMSNRLWTQAVSLIVSYVAAGLFAIWLWGGFSTDLPMGNADYTIGNPANLNALFNPLDYSMFFPGLPLNMGGQDDGFGYIGLGLWLVVILAILMIIRADSVKINGAFLISMVVMIMAALWFCTYPIITFGEKLFFSYRLPEFIDGIMAIFRCNGRGIWVLSYTLSISALIVVCKKSESIKKAAIIPVFLLICIILQTADISPLMRYKYEYCSKPEAVENPLTESQELKALVDTGRYKHVFMDESLVWGEAPTIFAMENHLTTNRFYLARQNEEANKRRNEEAKQELADDTFYIFPKSEKSQMKTLGLTIVYKDNYYYVGVADTLSD
ncbi:MAG: DUF6311 domain-containing protein [Lachnospiraceae bacterium]|nr:DUF6311 domain-containing protein [Lachnospiraceae bacterium]